ncbi:MAG: shikimate dehydrogenase family protein [Bacteroidales bacterium]
MDKYGLVGYPLSHSFSKGYFSDKFAKEHIDATYENFELPDIEGIRDILSDPDIKGLNVTIPYKEKVIPFLDSLDEAAGSIGAVNVIRMIDTPDGRKCVGCNSDVIGFMDSIRPYLNPHHTHALILGTGGASKAVEFGLKSEGLKTLLVSRKSDEDQGVIGYEQLSDELLKTYTVIVNTTPLGMYPDVDKAPAIPYEFLTDRHLLYDLIYNPAETLFMKKGKDQGAVAVNGLEMLYLQAEAAWLIWNK